MTIILKLTSRLIASELPSMRCQLPTIAACNKISAKFSVLFSAVLRALLVAGLLSLSGWNVLAATVSGSPSSCVNVPSVGTLTWTNPANAVSIDAAYATANATSATGTQLANYLECTGYGFAIPSGATINGITVNIVRNISSTRNTTAQDNAVRVVNSSGTIGTTDRSTTTARAM